MARLYGFEDWDGLIAASAGMPGGEAPGLSSTPPFSRIDEARGAIAPQQPMSARDWEALIGIMRERGLTALEANNMMDDAAIARLAAAIPHVTVLKLNGSNRLTHEGLRHLAKFEDLEEVEVGGWHSRMTDDGFAALRGLPRRRAVRSFWSRLLTDAGVRAALVPCPQIEEADFMGTAAGDGLIEALADKPGVCASSAATASPTPACGG